VEARGAYLGDSGEVDRFSRFPCAALEVSDSFRGGDRCHPRRPRQNVRCTLACLSLWASRKEGHL